MNRKKVLGQVSAWLPWLLLAAGLLMIGLQVRNPAALVHVGVPWAQTGALAVVLTAIILTGGIDLSVGSTVALCAMVQGVLWEQAHWPLGWAVAAALATGEEPD